MRNRSGNHDNSSSRLRLSHLTEVDLFQSAYELSRKRSISGSLFFSARR